MNPDLSRLQPYPFDKLSRLKAGAIPPEDKPHISLAIGEPKHAMPGFIAESIIAHLHGLSTYPSTRGNDSLREAIAEWLTKRFGLPPGSVDPASQVLPVNGTREALFAIAQCIVDRANRPLVVMPNPFYQIYEGAALLAGAEPYYVNCAADTGRPDFDAVSEQVWRHCQLLYLCTPHNPTGAMLDIPALQRLIELAECHGFVIASDECYSEIYLDESRPPPGLLQAAAAMGNTAYRHCLVFHSLSKRSNVPGLRSGFVAGDRDIIRSFLLYRTYHGCSMPPHTQAASTAAWGDERHVIANRDLYREKFTAITEMLCAVLNVRLPEGGFYLWPEVPLGGEAFARELFAQQNVTVLPGSYLAREALGIDPGKDRVRIALVAPLDECMEAARRMIEFIRTL